MAELKLGPSEVNGLEVVADFLRAIGAHYVSSQRLFRGHASTEWKPIASAYRDKINGIVRRDQLRFWRSMSQRFVSPQPTSELAYLVLAQHYGIPTGLLDWTTNPLIAMFFASQALEGGEDGEVVQVDAQQFHRIQAIETVEVFKEDRPQPLLLDTSTMNVRSTAQDSFMTLHTQNEPPIKARPVFRVRAVDKFTVRSALRLFGLTEERIYADLTVAAVSFKAHLQDEVELKELLG